MSNSPFVKHSALTAGTLSLIGLASVFCSNPSQAAILNGGFETGNFNEWKTTGNTTIQTSAYGSGPTEGKSQALLSTAEDNAVSSLDLETFLGLPSGSLDGVGNGETFRGSAIQQTFAANAGQVLTFDWNFLTNEGTPSPFFNDFSFVTIGSLSKIADTSSTFALSPTASYTDTNKRFESETGFKTFSYTIPTTGSYTLGIGVTNVGDPYGSSGVLVDKVALSSPSTSIPEPNSAFSLLAFGALGMGSLLKSKQKRTQNNSVN